MEKDDDGQRIYNLYLRVTQEGGTGDSTKWINTTAFTIDKFLDQAKAIESREGQNEINFKINYAERYNADTTACVWGAYRRIYVAFYELNIYFCYLKVNRDV